MKMFVLSGLALSLTCLTLPALADTPPVEQAAPSAIINGEGPGWETLRAEDFENVNCSEDTWTWKGDLIHCTGRPVGVIRTKQPVKNFELVAEWRHLKPAGNSGIFVWAPAEAMKDIKPGTLPKGGIEVQVLDHDFATQYEKRPARKATGSPPTATSSPSAPRR